MKSLLTAKEVAEIFRVSVDWVIDHATRRQPRLPSIKIGSGKGAVRRFDEDQIREFIEKWTKSA